MFIYAISTWSCVSSAFPDDPDDPVPVKPLGNCLLIPQAISKALHSRALS